MLADPALEARARDIGRELRCLVCRNQSIDDSDADLAHDLRVLVRERLQAGERTSRSSPISVPATAISCCCVRRSALGTVLLWVGPALILLLGGIRRRALLSRAGARSGHEATRRRSAPRNSVA